jgi:hypothetical protein
MAGSAGHGLPIRRAGAGRARGRLDRADLRVRGPRRAVGNTKMTSARSRFASPPSWRTYGYANKTFCRTRGLRVCLRVYSPTFKAFSRCVSWSSKSRKGIELVSRFVGLVLPIASGPSCHLSFPKGWHAPFREEPLRFIVMNVMVVTVLYLRTSLIYRSPLSPP